MLLRSAIVGLAVLTVAAQPLSAVWADAAYRLVEQEPATVPEEGRMLRIETPYGPMVIGVPGGDSEAVRRAAERLGEAARQQAERWRLAEDRPQVGEYWIGVTCIRVAALSEEQLDALHPPEDHGLLVSHVEPETPAAAAGIEADDIILAVGGAPLEDVRDLIEAVEEAGQAGAELQLTIFREGETFEVGVTPAERPEWASPQPGEPTMRRWLPREPMEGWERWEAPFRLQVPRPGAIVGRPVEIPDDLALQIEKRGSEPAEITVSRGDEQWTVEEGELDALPRDVRGHVEAMLRGLAGTGRVPIVWPREAAEPYRLPFAYPGEPVEIRPAPRMVPEGAAERLERRIEALEQALEQQRNEPRRQWEAWAEELDNGER